MKKQIIEGWKKRKKYLLLPVLVVPFLVVGFWWMEGRGVKPQKVKDGIGLNVQLPDAQLTTDKGQNKLTIYEQGAKDSLHNRLNGADASRLPENLLADSSIGSMVFDQYAEYLKSEKQPSEAELYQKFAQVRPDNDIYKSGREGLNATQRNVYGRHSDRMSQLEQMDNDHQSSFEKDPEVEQLNNMMDKVLKIQHPELLRTAKLQGGSLQKATTLPVRRAKGGFSVSNLDSATKTDIWETEFYNLRDGSALSDENVIDAVVDKQQIAKDGATLRLQLLSDILVSNNLIERGTFVSGIISLQGGRFKVEVSSIVAGPTVFLTGLTVFDLDGLEGIRLTESTLSGTLTETTHQSVQNIDIGSYDPSLKSQAVTAGVHAAKRWLGKKIKPTQLTIPAGYKVFLRNKE